MKYLHYQFQLLHLEFCVQYEQHGQTRKSKVTVHEDDERIGASHQ